MVITSPQLPPKAGYVEVEVDGVRTYRNVSTGLLIDEETNVPTVEQRVEALEVENAEIKLQLQQADDAAIELYEAQLEINAAQDDALIELYEMIGG